MGEVRVTLFSVNSDDSSAVDNSLIQIQLDSLLVLLDQES